ncbi:MAG TPA: sensor histidine kinase [Chloroflexota bacterium]|jgi:two-component system sensor histidine kinase DegS
MLQHSNAVSVDALEQEQRRLARTIHDGPAQMLTNLALHSEILERLIGVDDKRALQEVREMRQEALRGAEEMREMIYDLVPPGLTQRDLADVMAEHTGRLSRRYGLSVDIDAVSGLAIDKADQATIFRVVQEALQNVLHHGNTPRAWLRIGTDGPDVVAEVTDQGSGFDPEEQARRQDGHLGIAGMRERAELAGGTLLVESRPGTGARVVLRLPGRAASR